MTIGLVEGEELPFLLVEVDHVLSQSYHLMGEDELYHLEVGELLAVEHC